MSDCVVCDDLGCEFCASVDAPPSYDELVDRLMFIEGLDGDEAEAVATARMEEEL